MNTKIIIICLLATSIFNIGIAKLYYYVEDVYDYTIFTESNKVKIQEVTPSCMNIQDQLKNRDPRIRWEISNDCGGDISIIEVSPSYFISSQVGRDLTEEENILFSNGIDILKNVLDSQQYILNNTYNRWYENFYPYRSWTIKGLVNNQDFIIKGTTTLSFGSFIEYLFRLILLSGIALLLLLPLIIIIVLIRKSVLSKDS